VEWQSLEEAIERTPSSSMRFFWRSSRMEVLGCQKQRGGSVRQDTFATCKTTGLFHQELLPWSMDGRNLLPSSKSFYCLPCPVVYHTVHPFAHIIINLVRTQNSSPIGRAWSRRENQYCPSFCVPYCPSLWMVQALYSCKICCRAWTTWERMGRKCWTVPSLVRTIVTH
jgi:hypothetical protein